MNTDAELLRCYAEEKSQPAFAELVQRYVGLVYAVALRRVGGDVHLAEDVTQTVFNDLARKATALRNRETLAGWLYLSANHASAAVVRGERRRKARELAAHVMQTTLSSSEPNPDWTHLGPVIDDAIVALKEDDRTAIALRFFERRSFAEVGVALQVTEDAARKRVERALEKLRAALGRRGVTSTAAALGVTLATIASTSAPSGLGMKVAGHAITSVGSAGGSVALGSWLGLALPTASLLVLGGLILGQHRANDELRGELNRFVEERAALALIKADNRSLAGRLAEIDALRTASAEALPTLPPPARGTPPPVRTIAATIEVSPAGTIAWNHDSVSLRDFINRLRQAKGTADPESRIYVRVEGSHSAVTYVIDEARKAGIEHLTVEGAGKPDDKFSWWWF